MIEGKDLELNVTVNGSALFADYDCWHDFEISWYFRRLLSESYQLVFHVYVFVRRHRSYYRKPDDTRFFFVNDTNLLLVNTTVNDTGTYMLAIDCTSKDRVRLYFNATIIGKQERRKQNSTKICYLYANGKGVFDCSAWWDMR